MPLQSPYPSAEILDTDIGQILEEFIEDNWDLDDVESDKVGWGVSGMKMEKRRKNVVVRAYKFFSDIRDMALGGHLNDYFELWRVDVFVRDVTTTTSRSPKLFSILQHIEKIFLENKTGLQEKGISSVNCYQNQQVENPESEDIYHGFISLEIRYVTELV